MARHRAPRGRRGHPAPQPQKPAPDTPSDPELTEPPWMRTLYAVPTPEDVLAEPPADPVHVLPPDPEVQVVYPSGERVRVPIRDGMLIRLRCINGEPQIGVNLA